VKKKLIGENIYITTFIVHKKSYICMSERKKNTFLIRTIHALLNIQSYNTTYERWGKVEERESE